MKTYLAIKMTLLGCLQLVSPASVALGNDWLPDNADQVLLELPRNYSRYSEGLSLGERSGQQSDQKIAELIRYYLDIARDTGDERYLGYAHTLVAGRDSAEIDSEALILAYAALLQRGHRFEEALVLLDTLVERVPNHGQANLMSAYINVTLGRPQKALEFCRDIEPSLGPVMSLNCASSAKMLQGKFDQSYKLLSNLLARAHMSAVERMETLINLAEISKIRGDYQGAKKYFNRLLDEDPGDAYVLARLADTYTTAGQYDECIELLKNRSQPSLQLRYAIALKNKTGEVENSLQESLHEYFSVQLAREPELSSRDYALYLLSIKNQAESALDISLKNWQKQREIPDTELVLRAAWQARQTSRVDEVLSWVEETGLQDRDINNLLAQFKDK